MVETTDKSILVALAGRSGRGCGRLAGFNPVLRAERVVFPAGNLRMCMLSWIFSQRPQWVMGAATLLQPKRRGRCSPLRHWLAAQKQSRSALNIDFQQIVNASEYLDSSFDLVAERSGKQFQYEVSLSLEMIARRSKVERRS